MIRFGTPFWSIPCVVSVHWRWNPPTNSKVWSYPCAKSCEKACIICPVNAMAREGGRATNWELRPKLRNHETRTDLRSLVSKILRVRFDFEIGKRDTQLSNAAMGDEKMLCMMPALKVMVRSTCKQALHPHAHTSKMCGGLRGRLGGYVVGASAGREHRNPACPATTFPRNRPRACDGVGAAPAEANSSLSHTLFCNSLRRQAWHLLSPVTALQRRT